MKSKKSLIEKGLIQRDIETKYWDNHFSVRSVLEEVSGELYSFTGLPFTGILNSGKATDRPELEKYYEYLENDIIKKYNLSPIESTIGNFKVQGIGKQFEFARIYLGDNMAILLSTGCQLEERYTNYWVSNIFYTAKSYNTAKEMYNNYCKFIDKLENDNISQSEDLFVKLLISSRNGLEWRYLNIPKKTDIDLINYSKEFNEIVPERIDNFIKSDEGGLVIFRGDPGTGKSSYCKHLITKYKDVANFMIVPQDVILKNPEAFRLFLIDSLPCVSHPEEPCLYDEGLVCKDDCEGINRSEMKTIIIIEDCEKLLIDRDSLQGNSTSIILSDILNYSDGIVGDLVQCKFIFTFNTNLSKIDKALLRKGRMKLNYEFKKLYGEDLKVVMDKLEKSVTEKELQEGMTLAEIYNSEDDDYLTKGKKDKIGF